MIIFKINDFGGKIQESRSTKKSLVYTLIFSLIWNNLAFATHEIIELEFKGSSPSHRIPSILPLSALQDISHLEIDPDKQQVVVHKKNPQAEIQGEEEERADIAPATTPFVIQKTDITNLPWDLETELLKAFLRQHTAYLTSLGEEGYKLEFKLGLLGGMKQSGYKPNGVYGGIPYINIYPNPPKYGGGSGFSGMTNEDKSKWMQVSNQRSADLEKSRQIAQKKRQEFDNYLKSTQTNSTVVSYKPSQSQPFYTFPSGGGNYNKEEARQREEVARRNAEIELYSVMKRGNALNICGNPDTDQAGWLKTLNSSQAKEWKSKIEASIYQSELYEVMKKGNAINVCGDPDKEQANWLKTLNSSQAQQWKDKIEAAIYEIDLRQVMKKGHSLGVCGDPNSTEQANWLKTLNASLMQEWIDKIDTSIHQVELRKVMERGNKLGVSYDPNDPGQENWIKALDSKGAQEWNNKIETAIQEVKLRSVQEIFESDIFDDQLLEDWKQESTLKGVSLLKVGAGSQIIKNIIKYGFSKGTDFVKQGWKKIGQAYKGETVKGLKIDKSVENKLTQNLGEPYLSRDTNGLRWGGTKGNNQVRIMKPDKTSPHQSQQTQYVQVRRGGQVIGRDQKEVKPTEKFPKPADNPEAHIPYEEWVNWLTLLGE